MRELVVKYRGTCSKCGKELKIGEPAVHERYVGIFCPGCEPIDIEEIRQYKQERANIKADKYDNWANKRKVKAEATLNYNREHYTGDIAFNTQPGHIPTRARVIKQDDKAIESLEIAKKMEQKANLLRSVKVRGDADRERQAKRDEIRPVLKVGMLVDTVLYGVQEIIKINKKTILVGGYATPTMVDISFLRIPKAIL